MRVKINNQEVVIPTSLSEITLKQRIDFHYEHGILLAEMATNILAIEDDIERELEIMQFNLEKMFRTFSFFSGFSVESLKESEFIETIAGIYYASMAQLLEQEDIQELTREFDWNGETWHIANPELKNGDQMKFGSFIDSKQIIQDMANLGKSRWEMLLPLCIIFFRKDNDPYKESDLYEDSERMKLMETLPLDMALNVGFFLNGSLSMFISSQSLVNQELKAPVSI